MLVLSRQKDETVMIGDDVEVAVVDIRGDKVRLGITAPPHIPVHRKEVYDAIKRENRAAARVKPDDLKDVDVPKRKPKGRAEVPEKGKPSDNNKTHEKVNCNGCEGTQSSGL